MTTTLELQQRLQALGFSPGPLDGKPGPKTTAAVKAFQAAHPPLSVDGVAGPRTLAALFPGTIDPPPVQGSIRHVTDAVRAKIEQFEGLRLKAYYDSVGVITIGYGHTGPDVHPGLSITQAQADSLLRTDLSIAEKAVATKTAVKLNDNQFGALVSFTFNVGTAGFGGSTLLKKLNAGNYAAVPAALLQWNKGTIGGRKVALPGLTTRRKAEGELFAAA